MRYERRDLWPNRIRQTDRWTVKLTDIRTKVRERKDTEEESGRNKKELF